MDSESALYSLEEYRRCFSKPEPSYDANTCLVKHKRLRKRNVSPVAQKKARTHKKLNKQKRKMQCGGEQISKELSREVYFMSESEDDRLLVLLYCGHRSLVLYLPLTTTINELKHKLADVTQIPIENQRIFYGNTQVTKEQKLADFKCSTIIMFGIS